MIIIHQLALYTHILVGAFALLLFWVPVFTRKGNRDHKRFGRYFAGAMYAISISGVLMSSMDLMFPLAMHAAGVELSAERAASVSREIREFGLFLLSLSILVLATTRHGWLTMLHREDRSILRQPVHIALNAALLLIGVVLFLVGLQSGSVLFFVFGVLQAITAYNHFRYIYRQEIRPREWWIQHLNGLIGSGIGAYTAFTVFGGRRFFEEIFVSNFESLSILLWVTPGVVGGVAIALLSRRYRNQFGGAWVSRRASIRSQLFN
jgi:uncharacterized membrane protein YidH (DUF202 family)